MSISKIGDFLKESGVFFLATTDGDQPRVREDATAVDIAVMGDGENLL